MHPVTTLTIALVHHHDFMRDTLAKLFERGGHTVHQFDSAGALLGRLSECAPDCVVLGIHSLEPDQADSLELLLDISSKAAVVVVTVSSAVAELLCAKSIGRYQVLQLPIDPDELADRVVGAGLHSRSVEKSGTAG